MSKRVIIGLSGGVDSSVAAYLLKEQGYEVEALFMKNWEGDDEPGRCSAEDDLADARAVCQTLNIPLHTANFSRVYWDKVFTHFLDEYKAGRTPNPDILCNKEVKFNAFLTKALTLGADYIATGHYVKKRINNNQAELLQAKDRNKDQSYFLYAISPYSLTKCLFPLGEIEKVEVRKIAKNIGLVNHNKKDSTGICFIGERKFKSFLKEFLLAQPGDIENTFGEKIGRHDGLMYYTLGQRQGLGLGGLKKGLEAPWFVLEKDIERNVLIVGQGKNHPLLYSSGLLCDALHWLSGTPPLFPVACTAKVRYRQISQACIITKVSENQCCVMFSEKQRAVTPGQAVVFYDKNKCLGGGTINKRIA